MPNTNPEIPDMQMLPEQRVVLATSFRRDEVELACTLFTKGSVGDDIRIMLRSAAAQSLHRKFLALRDKAQRAESGA